MRWQSSLQVAVAVAAVLIAPGRGHADAAAAGGFARAPGTWRSLVAPGARWRLRSQPFDKAGAVGVITIESYDVRKVGDADVARLRWTYTRAGDKEELHAIARVLPTQVAVSKRGAWFLAAADGDAAVAAALRHKPTFADPPRLERLRLKRGGNYLEIGEAGGKQLLCIGYFPGSDAGDCMEGVCDARLCIAQAGFVLLEGIWAPGFDRFSADGYGD